MWFGVWAFGILLAMDNGIGSQVAQLVGSSPRENGGSRFSRKVFEENMGGKDRPIWLERWNHRR